MFTRIKELRDRRVPRSDNLLTPMRVAVLVFLMAATTTIAIAKRSETQKLRQERSYITNLAKEYSSEIQENLEKTLSITYPLAALVKEYQGTIPNFETVGGELLSLYPSAYAIALLPSNSESQIVFADPNQNAEPIELPCLRSQVFVPHVDKPMQIDAFPTPHASGGSVGCLPVFLESGETQSFWGFVSAVIEYQRLLKNIDIQQLDTMDLAYELHFIDPAKNEQKKLIASSASQKRNKIPAVTEMIPVPHGFWELKVFPVAGWNKAPRFLLSSLLAVFISFLVAALVKLFLDSKVHAGELKKVAYFDPLTSLPNRRLFCYRLEQILAAAERKQTGVAICYLDLDNFQRINDRFGEKSGDYILVRIAKRLQKFLRTEDLIARIGGDEFAIVLQDIRHPEEAELILDRIRDAVTSSIVLEAEVVAVSTSIGITIYPDDDSSTENLLRHANQALLSAKQYRKGGYISYKDMRLNQLEMPS